MGTNLIYGPAFLTVNGKSRDDFALARSFVCTMGECQKRRSRMKPLPKSLALREIWQDHNDVRMQHQPDLRLLRRT